MNKFIVKFLILFFILTNNIIAEENIMILKLKDGDVKIELFEDTAPNHVKRIQQLAAEGKYNGVVFHRVIDGFMAQTGDVQFGNSSNDNFIWVRNRTVIILITFFNFIDYLHPYDNFTKNSVLSIQE